MFGFFNATPYLEEEIIEDCKSDYKEAEKCGDVRLSKKAVYFHHDGTLYYLPYEAIEEALPMELNEHHSCCSGDSTMKVYKLLIKAVGQNVSLEFPSAEDSERASEIIKNNT